MKYRVEWSKRAENDLWDIWVPSTDQAALSMTAEAMESQLKEDGHEIGESRFEIVRIFHSPPLGMLFKVNQAAQTIRILRLWQYPKKQRD